MSAEETNAADGHSPTHAAMQGRVIEDRYRLLEPLGVGGMGVVYRADDLRLGRHVALKLLLAEYGADETLRQRFEREARALAAMSHPHIVTITDYGVFDGQPFLVMELLQGQTLEDALRRGGVAQDHALDVARQMLVALAYAHNEGFAHRDLKPGNVFLQSVPGERPHVKLLDFGLAKFVAGEDTTSDDGPALTRIGTILGTPAYMAPEQAMGQPADERADVYAVGVILFEMLAGRRPFEGDAMSLLKQHLVATLPALGDVNPARTPQPELDGLLRCAMAKERDARYSNGAAMLQALDALPRPSAPTGRDPATASATLREPLPLGARAERGRSWLGAAILGALAAAALLVGGIAAVAMYLSGDRAENEPLGAPRVEPLPTASGGQRATGEPTEGPLPAAVVSPAQAGPAEDLSRDDPWAGAVPASLARVRSRLDAGRPISLDTDRQLSAYVRQNRDDPRPFLLLARVYVSRSWRADAVDRYGRAFDLSPSARNDPNMLRDLITLAAHPTSATQSAALVRRAFGREALGAIDAALTRSDLHPEEASRLRRLRASL